MERHRRNLYKIIFGLALLLLAALTAAVSLGPVGIRPHLVGEILLHKLSILDSLPQATPVEVAIVWEIRFPRACLGAVVGASLALIGHVLQGVVRNPLADPHLLGVSAGASLGAVLAITVGTSGFGLYSASSAAFAGAIVSLGIVYALASSMRGGMTSLQLILAGVAVANGLSAATTFLVLRARQEGVGAALFWLLGGLGRAQWDDLLLPSAALVVSITWVLLNAGSLNAIVHGDETASTLGVKPKRLRQQMFLMSSLLTAVVVAISGSIGFIGLLVPHVARIFVGENHRRSVPVAMLLGASFLLLADVIARTIAQPTEIPVGIVTAVVGSPLFLLLLSRSRPMRTV